MYAISRGVVQMFNMNWWRCAIVALLALWMPIQANAHALGQSYVFLNILESSVTGRVEIPISDVNRLVNANLATDGSVEKEQLAPHANAIASYVKRRVHFSPDGTPAPLRIIGQQLFSTSFAQFVLVEFEIEGLTELPRTIDVDYGIVGDLDSDHRSMLVIENNWRTGTFNNEANVSLTFTPDDHRKTLDLSSSSLWRGFMGMIEIGAHHIAIGIDHILFIVALLLPSVMRRESREWEPVPGFRDAFLNLVKIVTIFTVAHSITLSLASLGIVQVSSRVVESIIAASIILVALDIVIPLFGRRIWLVVFAFGLFHGFGFASVLADMGINAGFTTLTLLGFNIGVELGQLMVVGVLFPVLFLLRRAWAYAHIGLPYGATALMLVASYWFVERAFEVDLPAGALLNSVMGLFA